MKKWLLAIGTAVILGCSSPPPEPIPIPEPPTPIVIVEKVIERIIEKEIVVTATPPPEETRIPTPTREPTPTQLPQPTETPAPTSTPAPTYTPLPTYTPFPTYTPLATPTPLVALPTNPTPEPTYYSPTTPTPTPNADLVKDDIPVEDLVRDLIQRGMKHDMTKPSLEDRDNYYTGKRITVSGSNPRLVDLSSFGVAGAWNLATYSSERTCHQDV